MRLTAVALHAGLRRGQQAGRELRLHTCLGLKRAHHSRAGKRRPVGAEPACQAVPARARTVRRGQNRNKRRQALSRHGLVSSLLAMVARRIT